MKKLIILRGISGSGKSKLAERFKKEENAVVFSTDDFFETEEGYSFDPTKLISYHKKNIDRTYKALLSGTSCVIVDNTNIKLWEMKPYVLMGILFDYDLSFYEPTWTPYLKDNKGSWNVDFILELQKNEDRVASGKTLSRANIQKMSDNYDYYFSIQKSLQSKIPNCGFQGWEKEDGGL